MSQEMQSRIDEWRARGLVDDANRMQEALNACIANGLPKDFRNRGKHVREISSRQREEEILGLADKLRGALENGINDSSDISIFRSDEKFNQTLEGFSQADHAFVNRSLNAVIRSGYRNAGEVMAYINTAPVQQKWHLGEITIKFLTRLLSQEK